jgi:hypothetical protein
MRPRLARLIRDAFLSFIFPLLFQSFAIERLRY